MRDGRKLVNEIPSHERFMSSATNLLNAMESLEMEDEESEFITKWELSFYFTAHQPDY